ncbi:signal recognition particle subunit SRP19/SEC65 family protein [Methanofollis fontis]|uniref:Signal recognition particle 19 kDa protein n=1 Tax=Methanofollis fontis TaxID=2052832 RepID=A0A483CN03_9EURY|nr:signal recognition particle subunit SRP19/SEC65 family protein [Methanofollis fontis]TAJ43330.1 signal recognition particle protein Srp19 [Methanofollis fontis]
MEHECILYPCYFHAGLKRAEGRRVPRAAAAKNPSLADLEAALKKCGYTYRTEEKHHPAHWHRREGRAVVSSEEPKGSVIRKVAGALEVKR